MIAYTDSCHMLIPFRGYIYEHGQYGLKQTKSQLTDEAQITSLIYNNKQRTMVGPKEPQNRTMVNYLTRNFSL